ncbi:MAG: type II toxin-antitoxin system RelE/ParE family toxin [Bacteroidetes bacterium]|nr:type II toxin-antitoxin system RelE/ParE family toxin [Bacteroidota bacterium]
MKYSILYKRSASEELLQLPVNIAYKVRAAINRLSENPRPQGCKKLKGSVNEYRIRIGNYRVIYTIANTVLIVTVIKIAHRKDVYR